MNSKFLKIYSLFMESIDTKRKPIKKVNAMNNRQFIKFLRELLPYIKNGKVDLNDIRITEKVDGNAIRLLTKEGNMLFESSYSGVTTWDQIPMKEAGKFLYDNYSQLFHDIYDLIKSDFKIIGELIWINEMEKTDKVTPVGASYLTSKFGKNGGIVVFDILKIENDELVPFEKDQEKEIFDMIRDLNNEEFSFYLSDSIDITKNVTFDLDIENLQKIIDNPEYNKERFDKKKDEKIISELNKIKENIIAQLSNIIDNTKGAFSETVDLIEGIVIRINSSGNQYGLFSNGYKQMKNKYWEKYEEFTTVLNEFYKSVFGYSKVQVKRNIKSFDSYKDKFDYNRDTYIEKLNSILNEIENDESIPAGPKKMQLNMGNREIDKIKMSYEEFIKKYE